MGSGDPTGYGEYTALTTAWATLPAPTPTSQHSLLRQRCQDRMGSGVAVGDCGPLGHQNTPPPTTRVFTRPHILCGRSAIEGDRNSPVRRGCKAGATWAMWRRRMSAEAHRGASEAHATPLRGPSKDPHQSQGATQVPDTHGGPSERTPPPPSRPRFPTILDALPRRPGSPVWSSPSEPLRHERRRRRNSRRQRLRQHRQSVHARLPNRDSTWRREAHHGPMTRCEHTPRSQRGCAVWAACGPATNGSVLRAPPATKTSESSQPKV